MAAQWVTVLLICKTLCSENTVEEFCEDQATKEGPWPTKFGAAQPITAESTVIAAKAANAPENTCHHEQAFRLQDPILSTELQPRGEHLMLTVSLELFMAMMAAMKNVLSPISETRIIPQDFKNPCRELQRIARTVSSRAWLESVYPDIPLGFVGLADYSLQVARSIAVDAAHLNDVG